MFGYPPLVILVGGSQLTGYTDFTLSRQKKDLTGSCSIFCFLGFIPDKPLFAAAVAGAEILVYVGGEIAFTGTVDTRSGNGKQGRDTKGRFTSGKGGDATLEVDKDTYQLMINARGKAKHLLNSSHQHKTTNMKEPTTKDAIEALVGPFKIGVEWKAATVKLDRIRFRDGANVFSEVSRIGTENAHYIYETREGKLRVIDGPGEDFGEDIVLGSNILRFNVRQSEVDSNSEIQVKGQRTDKKSWGETALLKTFKVVQDANIPSYSPKVIQHYGDATDEALKRRAEFEANKRTEAAKEIKVEVFHIQSRSGRPWDIGVLHYVEIPPEGVFDVMECTAVEYHVSDKKLTTTLTLSPLPTGSAASGASPAAPGLASFSSTLSTKMLEAAAKRAAAGADLVPGSYPLSWGGPALSPLSQPSAAALAAGPVVGLASFAANTAIATVLPASFKVKL